MLEILVLAAALFVGPEAAQSPPPVVALRIDPNQTGRQPSAYRGEYFEEAMEPYRKCVGQREGRFQYWVTGSFSRFFGTYQMTGELVTGAAWMMGAELKSLYGPSTGREIRDTLLGTPGNKWARYYADMAFWTVLNWESRGSGAHHWAGGRFSCRVGMKDRGGVE